MIGKRPQTDLSDAAEAYTGFAYDLRAVRDWCEIILTLPVPPSDATQATTESITRQAMTAGVLIMYRRCFEKSDNRGKYPASIRTDILKDELLARTHGRVIQTANNYTAHSSNDYDQTEARVSLDEDTVEILGAEVQSSRFQLANGKIKAIRKLAEIWIAALEPETRHLLDRLVAEVDNMTPDERRDLPDARDLSEPPDEVDPSRTNP